MSGSSDNKDPTKKDNDDMDKKSENDAVNKNLPGISGRSDTVSIPMGSINRSDNIQFRVRGSTMTSSSPPKFVSFEEIMKAAHGIQNMALAHEIAIDSDFRLEPFEPPDNSLHKLVKETMHRAFFEILREQLNSDPPEFSQALILLDDVKQGLFSILLPRHTRIREMIEEVLDADFIKQQVENGAIDFPKYAAFVLDLMGKLAAPARDETILNISKMTDTVDIFRSILETLEVLKLDLANSLIAMIRPHVQAQSVQYEKQKFKEFLDIQEDGLESTKQWLIPHIDKTDLQLPVNDLVIIRNVTAQSLAKAFLKLLEWDESSPFPETVQMDSARFKELAGCIYRLIATASILFVSPSCSASNQEASLKFKLELKEKISIVLGTTSTDVELAKLLPAAAEQIISDTESLLSQFGQDPLNDEVKEAIRNQVTSLRDPENRIRHLVRQRMMEFLKEILVCGGGSRPVPPGMSTFQADITSLAGILLRLVMHNKAVFTNYYMDIIAEELAKTDSLNVETAVF